MKEKIVISVSLNAVVQAEAAILGCSHCAPGATVPFWHVVDDLRTHPGAEAVYILPTLATCPNCRARIDETTMVVPKYTPEAQAAVFLTLRGA